ncbi:MFS transporter [Maridesulfovibrio frigidus]|uniref:MFS transporter n=1 Tax=Maridesulfovibrio frigidus TaxID=340956 RepID=UPI0004E113A6|nr:MFS transporter [Maridesulfovibrio frigidus]
MNKNSLITTSFLLICGIVFLIVCNAAVYFSLHVYLLGMGFTDSKSGLIIGLYAMAGMIMYGFMSSYIRRDNAFKAMTLGIVLMFVSGNGFLFVDSFGGLATLRLMQGIGGFFLFAPCTALLVSIIPKGKEGSAFSIYSAALLLPYSLLPLLSDILMPYVKDSTWLYAGTAWLMLPVSFAVLYLRKKIVSQDVNASKLNRLGAKDSFSNLLTPTIMGALLTNFFYFMVFTSVFFLFQNFALSRGIKNSGIYFTVQMGVMIAIRLGANNIFNLTNPKILITTAMLITSASLATLIMLNDAKWLIPMAVMFGLGMGLCTPPLNALLYLSSDSKFRAFNANMMVLTIHCGSFFGPFMGSRIVEKTGYNFFLMSAAILTFIVGICFMVLVPITKDKAA